MDATDTPVGAEAEAEAGFRRFVSAASVTAKKDRPLPGPPSASVRKAVGKLKLQVHVYDRDASRRFVMIDGTMLYEGESVKQGLTIERIVQPGVVLSWKGEAFLVSAND
jgi:hypothetical protein